MLYQLFEEHILLLITSAVDWLNDWVSENQKPTELLGRGIACEYYDSCVVGPLKSSVI